MAPVADDSNEEPSRASLSLTAAADVEREEADPANSALRDLRIDHIVELMRDFAFRRGKTAKELAKEWGLSLSYVHKLTAEASKRARAYVDADTVAAEVVPGEGHLAVDHAVDPQLPLRGLELGDLQGGVDAIEGLVAGDERGGAGDVDVRAGRYGLRPDTGRRELQ